MGEQLINLGSIMGKDVLNLADGAFIGKIQGVVIGQENKVSGIKLKRKGLGGSASMIPFANVKAFGNMVTVMGTDGIADGKEVLGKSVITADGISLGRVWELSFDAETGVVEEIVLKGSLLKERFDDKGILSGAKILSFGKDAVIAMEGTSLEDVEDIQEDMYGDWQAVDEALNELDAEEAAEGAQDGAEKEESFEEVFDEMTESLGKTLERTIRRVKDEVTSEKFKDQTEKFIDTFSEQTKGLLGDLREKIKQVDTETLKEEIKSKVSRKDNQEEELAFVIVGQLQGKTVEKPLLDGEGNSIIWPGQIIGLEEVKKAIRGGKLQELLDLATVSLHEPVQPKESTEADLTPEDSAFIQEEIQQMKQAEQNE